MNYWPGHWARWLCTVMLPVHSDSFNFSGNLWSPTRRGQAHKARWYRMTQHQVVMLQRAIGRYAS